ncbi:ATP-dependent helicase [Salana multivorans]|nr:ATP-dependent DNA helicase [Salana multivorans]
MTTTPVLTPPGRVSDPARSVVVDAVLTGGHHVVYGAPGSGKSTTAVELLATLAEREDVGLDEVLLLAPTRQAATRLRDAVSRRLARTTGRVVARTPASFAFSLLRQRAALLGEAPPMLLTGADQDAALADLLAGHTAGEGRDPGWPADVPAEALGLATFRHELRDVLMRAAEAGWDGADLAEMGRRHGRPAWVACGRVMAEYDEVTRLGETTPDRGTRYDVAGIVDEAARALDAWDLDLPRHPRPRWRVVVHDDYQDATMATARLLEVLARDGARIVVLGDPDTAVQTFRGGLPALLEEATREPAPRVGGDVLGGDVIDGGAGGDGGGASAGGGWPMIRTAGAFGARRHLLPTVWRGDELLRTVVEAATDGLPALGETARRRSRAADGAASRGERGPRGAARPDPAAVSDADRSAGADRGSSVEVAVTASIGEEGRLVAHHLRRHRLAGGIGWDRMAVLARSSGQLAALRRGLRAAGVPVAVSRDVPLAAEQAVRPLLRVLEVLTEETLGAEAAAELLLSPLGGLDPVGLRALRRALRAHEVRSGGRRPSDELLIEAIESPDGVLPELRVAEPARRAVERVARMLGSGARALDGPGDVESVLWAVWEASGRAEPWRRLALGDGVSAERAHADLDAVVALFRAAEGFAERREGGRPHQFLEYLRAQDFATDTLAGTGEREAVEVLTVASAAGREWDVVVVAGVQEDVWPDLRLRTRLLDPVGVSDLATGRGAGPVRPIDARRAVLWDERRLFASAVSRTHRHLLVTAVQDNDTRPSVFLDVVDPRDPLSDELRPTVAAPPALDLRGLVARLRREVLDAARETVRAEATAHSGASGAAGGAGAARGAAAASLLATLARAGVPGADPREWWGRAASTDAPAWGPQEPVPVRPSSLVMLGTCSLRWALEAAGAQAGSSLDADVGTLVHAIAAELPEGTREEMLAELDARWDTLRLPDTWAGRRRREEAERMIGLLAAYVAGIPRGSVETEVAFEVRIGRADLVGRVDRIERTGDGGARIVDLKTGKSPIPVAEADAHAQLAAYQAAVAAGGFGDDVHADGARLVYVGGARRAAAIRDQAAPEDDWPARLVAEAAETMASAEFLATTGSQCQTCPVRTSCPARPSGDRVVGR